jgi:phospholipid/cholesterol/gamma-HCH transport system substrate-binding protein/paraquat-inducible protein B
MAVEKSYARLGLFLVVALVVVLATALFLLQRMRRQEVLPLVTYTTENVSGLDVASPVRYRGVSVGRVTDIRVDPHNVSIEIGFEVFLDRLITFGITSQRIREVAASGLVPGMRAQIVGNPVTGEAYVLLDRPANPPPPIALNFTPNRTYVPSMPTMLSKVQDRLPQLLERADATLATLREIINRMPASIDRSDRFFTTIERVFRESDFPALTADSRKFLAEAGSQLAQLEQIKQFTSDMSKLIASQEKFAALVADTHDAIKTADLPGTTQTARETMDRTNLAADDLRRSLPSIRDSLDQLRQLARMLDEQPESIVYGRRRAEAKNK